MYVRTTSGNTSSLFIYNFFWYLFFFPISAWNATNLFKEGLCLPQNVFQFSEFEVVPLQCLRVPVNLLHLILQFLKGRLKNNPDQWWWKTNYNMSFFEGVYIKSSNLSNQCTVVLFDLEEWLWNWPWQFFSVIVIVFHIWLLGHNVDIF